jgi:hypothetical protein
VNIISSCGFHEKPNYSRLKYQCFTYTYKAGKAALGIYVSAMLLTRLQPPLCCGAVPGVVAGLATGTASSPASPLDVLVSRPLRDLQYHRRKSLTSVLLSAGHCSRRHSEAGTFLKLRAGAPLSRPIFQSRALTAPTHPGRPAGSVYIYRRARFSFALCSSSSLGPGAHPFCAAVRWHSSAVCFRPIGS